MTPIEAVFIGEGMLELSASGESWNLAFGGDTLNTAVHMVRNGIPTGFMTALGTDSLSVRLCQSWQEEGLDTSLVLTNPARQPGLYMISLDDCGERTFAYWRNESAARTLFACAGLDAALARAEHTSLLGFSLITLAILPPEGRLALLDLANKVRSRGGIVAFDGNYRPSLWENRDCAITQSDAAIAVASIGLPTLDDETALRGTTSAADVAQHWQSLGCTETLVKLGEKGCRLPDGATVSPPSRLDPVDTSGAGDAFNAGYLAARLRGAVPRQAAEAGNRLAGWCIMRRGALPLPE